MSGQPWWDLHQGRLEFEIDALNRAGIKFRIDEDAKSKGIFKLHLQYSLEDGELALSVIFPDLYPYFRFEIFSDDVDLPHHQNPISKALCFIGRSTHNWDSDDTLAQFITERLPNVLRTGSSDDLGEVQNLEEHQAEPYSDYLPHREGTAIIVDSSLSVDARLRCGTLDIRRFGGPSEFLRGIVTAVRDDNGNILTTPNDKYALPPPSDVIFARWVRMPGPPPVHQQQSLFDHLRKSDPHADRARSTPVHGGSLYIWAGLFPEEIRTWRQMDTGWLFSCAILTRDEKAKLFRSTRRRRSSKPPRQNTKKERNKSRRRRRG